MSDNSSRTSVRSDSESEGESRGRGRRDPEAVEGEPSLYVNPTIARDETQGESSRREQLLTTFNNRITSGPPLKQRNVAPAGVPPGPIPPIPPGMGVPMPPGMSPMRGGPPQLPPFRRIDSDGFAPRVNIVRSRSRTRRYRRRRSRTRSPSPIDRGSFPRAKISTKSSWRRKATQKRSGSTEDNSSDQSPTRPKRTKDDGVPDVSPQAHTSSGKDGSNDTQSSMGSAAVELSQLEIASDQANGDDVLVKQAVLKLAAAKSGSISDGEKPRGSRDDSASASRKEEPDEEDTTMAEALNAITEKYFRLDVLDQKDEMSKFIAYLLDTIEKLEAMIRYNQASDDDASSAVESDTETDDEDKPVIPRGQILHRIYCMNDDHRHDRIFFEDEPVYKDKNRFLAGQVPIPNLDFFLRRHPDVCYVVIKEHKCAGNERQRSRKARVFPDGRDGMSERLETLNIVSPKLQRAFLSVAEFHPFPIGKQPGALFQMDAPYHFLFHHRHKLEAISHEATYGDVLRPLLEWLVKQYEKEYAEAERLFEEGFVTAHHLSKLFKPNQMVVHRSDSGHLAAYVLHENAILKKEKLSFHGWSWQYDGQVLQRRDWNESMGIISEEQIRISSLVVHPMEHSTQGDKSVLEKRGKKYWAMREQTYTCYTGWDANHEYLYKNARFMVDTATYHLMHPMAKVLSQSFPDAGVPPPNAGSSLTHVRFDTHPKKISKDEKISPDDILLLPASVLGFNFQAKKWTRLVVDNTHAVDWNKKAFDRLVLDQKMKDMIYALVDVQISAGKMEDIITGKGNGLIILLHGSPGTGKTLTAESVAEISEKPLYRVTCGDIGTEAEEVEKYLETVMYLGKIWNCVLLLDEADVFLEERTMADLQRNSLVSVFLRTLEYYEGILILTSNRVGTFDEAFKSRIQVAIHYNNLTKASRKAIWQNFLDMIEESPDEDANLPELERRLDELARQDMNGRQIRNALLTARQLAKHRQESLDWSHLSQVIKTSAEFHKYLVTVKGHSDEQWAREESLR